MVIFDGFYSLELIYLADYAKIINFQLFPVHFINEMAQNHILPSPNLFHPLENADICRETFFYYQDGILKFLRWLYFLKLDRGTERVS